MKTQTISIEGNSIPSEEKMDVRISKKLKIPEIVQLIEQKLTSLNASHVKVTPHQGKRIIVHCWFTRADSTFQFMNFVQWLQTNNNVKIDVVNN
jgi:hypothetical protein